MLEPLQSTEYRFGGLIVGGQAHGVWVRSARIGGVWHNALVFRREGKLSSAAEVVVGTSWHQDPETARRSAEALAEVDLLAYYRRALRPRPPL